jgi:hypothetical protein
MTDDAQGGQAAPSGEGVPAGQRRRSWPQLLILIAVLIVLAVFLVPPLVSIGRYKSRITEMVSASFGRPVRLSSVELRLLPRPGFVLTDLTVADDPEYGAEPFLHANTVRANIRLLSLWRGRLEIGSVSVDEASMNIVRAEAGRWNLDPLFRSAAKAAPTSDGVRRFPSFPNLEATNSRINFKDGAEKLPFSIVDTDLEFWEESPGEWRVQLRGQPVRTDVVLDMADTGIVRLDATAHSAPVLSRMPLRVDLDWRDAQLGQLSRLLVGSDADWRGNLTGNLHLEGTPDAANVTARLRAESVHRAEFAPAAALDFDANCSLVYHYSRRALENLVCDSPLGDGHIRLTGDMPGANAAPIASVELDRIPVGAGLDLLRTMRRGIDSDLQAAGTISGKLAYSGAKQTTSLKTQRAVRGRAGTERPSAETQGPLTGSFTVDGFTLSGGGLDQPLRAPRFTLEPIAIGQGDRNGIPAAEGIAGTMTIPAGGDAPLAVNLRLALYGYQAIVHGPASIARARQIAKLAGTPDAAALDGLAGEPLLANLTLEGPWLPNEADAAVTARGASPAENAPGPLPTDFDRGVRPGADSITGTVALHNANWRADFLANHVLIANATLHLDENAMRWDPVEFSYGPVKGSLKITAPLNCAPPESAGAAAAADKCAPQFEAQFGALNAETVQATFLGARGNGTLLSDLIDRLHAASITPWPVMSGTIRAESLVLGPVTLQQPSAKVKVSAASADFSELAASALGGQVKASGTVSWATGDQAAPGYSISAQFAGLSGAAAGQLLAARWTGGPINVDGKLDAAGFSAKDLAASAKGTLHFDWKHGGVTGQGAGPADKAKGDLEQAVPARFDAWSGDATIGGGTITPGENTLIAGGRKLAVQGTITFGNAPNVDLRAATASDHKGL